MAIRLESSRLGEPSDQAAVAKGGEWPPLAVLRVRKYNGSVLAASMRKGAVA